MAQPLSAQDHVLIDDAHATGNPSAIWALRQAMRGLVAIARCKMYVFRWFSIAMGMGGLRHLQLISVHLCPEFHASLRTSAQKKRAPRLVPGAQHWPSGQELRCFLVIFSIKIDPNKNKHTTFPWFPTFSHTFSEKKPGDPPGWGYPSATSRGARGFQRHAFRRFAPWGPWWKLAED